MGVLQVKGKKVSLEKGCVECKTCSKVCPEGVFTFYEPKKWPLCTACPLQCSIPDGSYGACHRYVNEGGEIKRKARLITYEEVKEYLRGPAPEISEPLITGIGSGTTYPDFRPSPIIVKGVRNGVDIVTVVTEAPLSYSGLKLKLDTDQHLGSEGKRVFYKRKGRHTIGHLCTEEYGSKMISLGGVNIFTSKHGLFSAKVIKELIDGKSVEISVEDGASLRLKIGDRPVVNGVVEDHMRVGCGSATAGLFAPYMAEAADEVIVLDGHITGLFTEHPAGRYLNVPRSGIYIKGQKSTDGRYFLEKGDGWGGTNIHDPLEVIDRIDTESFKDGMSLLITETTGKRSAYLRMENGRLVPAQPSKGALRFLEVLRDTCQASRVSAVLAGGVGGSARAGVTREPIKLTRAVHSQEVVITIGGARPFIFPGGGINFLVDVEKIRFGSIYLSPTPSLILPVEYTMTYKTFKEIGGHIEAVRDLEEVLAEGRT